MKELSIRAATGAVYVALTLGAALLGPLTTFVLFLPVCVLASRELHSLLFPEDRSPAAAWNVLLAISVYVAIGVGHFIPEWNIEHIGAVAFAALLVGFTVVLIIGVPDLGRSVGGMFMQVFIVAAPFGTIPHLFSHGPWLFIGFMLMLWTNDTGAYIVGRSVGRIKLLPTVSPKKTVEGFVGGVLLTLLVAYVLSSYHTFLSITDWFVCGALVSLTATLGDLLESGLKRASGVKDSGTVLPGHGGILDRFDGFLLAIPAMMLYLVLRA